ncbi:MAG: universal stress protein [Nitrospiraceae bacterium]
MKILVAVDGSKYGRWAVEWVGKIPFASAAQATALHVVDTVSIRAPFMVQPVVVGNEQFIRKEIKRLEQRAKKVVEETKALVSSLNLKGTVTKEQGPIAPTLLKRAPKRDGLVVMGSWGLDALDRFMLGSVSTQVTLHAPCSVLVVKGEPRPIRRIVLATDGSKSSDKALRFLVRNLRGQQAGPNGDLSVEVAVVHIMPFLKYPEVKDDDQKLHQRYAEQLINAGYVVESISQLGHPADGILRVASRKKQDMIITGAKGLGAIARFLLGSVSTKVLQHSSCSVLVVR